MYQRADTMGASQSNASGESNATAAPSTPNVANGGVVSPTAATNVLTAQITPALLAGVIEAADRSQIPPAFFEPGNVFPRLQQAYQYVRQRLTPTTLPT